MAALVAWLALAPSAVAQQLAPRLTGEVVLAELGEAQHALANRPEASAAAATLGVLSASLQALADAQRAAPADLMDDAVGARILRAHAAAIQAKVYAAQASGCGEADRKAMAAALAGNLDRLAAGTGASKSLPVLESLQTMDRQPLLALHRGTALPAMAIEGRQLLDPQCPDPVVTANSLGGAPLDAQPRVTGASPARIELAWPKGTVVPAQAVLIQVQTTHKAFLRGCTAQPPASIGFGVADAGQVEVSYAVGAVCGANGQAVTLGKGRLPPIGDQGGRASVQVPTASCVEPQRYTVEASVARAGEGAVHVGPITQTADASITTGLPGGLVLTWSPQAQTLAVMAKAAQCAAVH